MEGEADRVRYERDNLEEKVERLQASIVELKDLLRLLRASVQKNCGHWYEPGYGLRCWVPDKWVPEALGFKPKGPDAESA